MISNRLTLERSSEYVKHLLAQRCSASARRHIASLRAFSRMLESQGQLFDRACLQLPRQLPAKIPENLSAVSLAGFETLPLPASPKSVRDYTLSILHELAGISVAQLRALDVDDVDVEAGMVRLVGRQGRGKLMLISGQPAAGLRRWVAVRHVLGARDPALFISLHWTAGRSQPGTRLSCRAVSEVLRRMRRELDEQG
jgi:site-specific recombinase XerC